MVIGGLTTDFSAELVDLDSDATCQQPANLTDFMPGPVATLIEGELIACARSFCLTYDLAEDVWEHKAELSSDQLYVYGSADIVMEGKWYILGGSDSDKSLVYSQGGSFASGEKLPYSPDRACAVRVNSTHFVFLGGDPNFGKAYLVEPEGWTWTPLPESVYPRQSSACALVGNKVYVVGGSEFFAAQSVEVLNLDSLEWSFGPMIPGAGSIQGASVVQEESGFLVVGGADISFFEKDTTYEFNGEDRTWRLMDKRLGVERSYAAVVKVPKDMGQC